MMITVNSVLGNIRSDKKLQDVYQKLNRKNKVEKILLSRMEAQKSRIRRTTDEGTDIAIILPHGFTLKHGDVLLLEDDKMIIIEYEPEDVLGFKIKDELSNSQKIAIAIKLGHTIGNLHRPISVKGGVTYVPIQSDAEIANIKEILLPIIDYIDIQHARIIFEQELGTKVHVH